MTKVRARGEQVRHFIVGHVDKHPADIAKVTADRFRISRQAVNKHLQKLVEERALVQTGATRNLTYRLAAQAEWKKDYPLSRELAEDAVWRSDVAPLLGKLPDNVMDIWHYGFTEILNNAVDHSDGRKVSVYLNKTTTNSEIFVHDDGIGIFNKIQTALKLLDPRHAVLELAKGKLTTDPKHHTGEGIFFSSRMFDEFAILSGGIVFSHEYGKQEDWILENRRFAKGTAVWMKLSNHTGRTTTKIFNQYSSGDDYGFTKTVVPVRLAQYGDDKLVSRSQAKRLLVRVDRFKTVIFDFTGVDSIGQAFADEIFRVFSRKYPQVELVPIKTNSGVKRMIERARKATTDDWSASR